MLLFTITRHEKYCGGHTPKINEINEIFLINLNLKNHLNQHDLFFKVHIYNEIIELFYMRNKCK